MEVFIVTFPKVALHCYRIVTGMLQVCYVIILQFLNTMFSGKQVLYGS